MSIDLRQKLGLQHDIEKTSQDSAHLWRVHFQAYLVFVFDVTWQSPDWCSSYAV